MNNEYFNTIKESIKTYAQDIIRAIEEGEERGEFGVARCKAIEGKADTIVFTVGEIENIIIENEREHDRYIDENGLDKNANVPF